MTKVSEKHYLLLLLFNLPFLMHKPSGNRGVPHGRQRQQDEQCSGVPGIQPSKPLLSTLK